MDAKWILFDAMGVIFMVGDDTNALLVPFIQHKKNDIPRDYIIDRYLLASLGKISSVEFWKGMNIVPSGNEKEIEKEYLDTCITIDSDFMEVAGKLSEKYHIGILSNDVSEWSIYLNKKYALNDVIELSIISGDVHCRKPCEEIYKKAIEKCKINPSECIFIDDRDKNLISAKETGLKVIRFLRDDFSTSIEGISCISSLKELLDLV